VSIIEARQYIHGSANVDTGPSATLRTGSDEGKVDTDVIEWHLEREVRNEQPKSVGHSIQLDRSS